MKKNKWIAAILNALMPGLGFFYARKQMTAAIVCLLSTAAAFGVRALALNFILFVIFLGALLLILLYGIIAGYRAVDSDKEYSQDPSDKPYVYGANIVIYGSVIAALVFKFSAIEFLSIPTPAMKPTLHIGDFMAVKKTSVIDRGDVTVFWWPNDTTTRYVKRCIGVPGDSIMIKAGEVFVNGKARKEGELALEYIVTTSEGEINPKVLQKIGVGDDDFRPYSQDRHGFYLSQEQANSMKTLSFVKQMEPVVNPEGIGASGYDYEAPAAMGWNVDFFGPIYLPKKGDKIELTPENITLYSKCIRLENSNFLSDGATININGQQISTYVFKQNYYFMMGDNRHNTLDSRYWGLVPEKFLIGKSMYLYWAKDTDRIGTKL